MVPKFSLRRLALHIRIVNTVQLSVQGRQKNAYFLSFFRVSMAKFGRNLINTFG